MGIKDGIYLAILLVVLATGGWLYLSGEHRGVVKCEAKDTKAVTAQESSDAKADRFALAHLRVDNEKLRGLLAAGPPRILVRVPGSCPARDPAPRGDPPASAGAGPPGGVQPGALDSVDIGPGVQLLAEVGELVSNELRACQLKAADAAGVR